MKYHLYSVYFFIFVILLSGCSQKIPDIQVMSLKTTNEMELLSFKKINVLTPKVGKDNNISQLIIRSHRFTQPTGNNFNENFYNRFLEHIRQAKLYDQNSTIQVTPELLEQEINTPIIGDGNIYMKARLIVTKNGVEIYDKTFENNHIFTSSFFGFIAIPNAAFGYTIAVAKLIDNCLKDQGFRESIK